MTCVRPVVWMHQASEFPDGERLGSGRTRPPHVPARHLLSVLTTGGGTGGKASRNQQSRQTGIPAATSSAGGGTGCVWDAHQGPLLRARHFSRRGRPPASPTGRPLGKACPIPVRGAGSPRGRDSARPLGFQPLSFSPAAPGPSRASLPTTGRRPRPVSALCPPPRRPRSGRAAGQLCGPQASAAPSRRKHLREGVPRW